MPAPVADIGAVIERPRLLRRLEDFADRALTLIVGPAGSGKSTLLDQWIATFDEHRPTRVDLDSTDPVLSTDTLHAVFGSEPRSGSFDPDQTGDAIASALADRCTSDQPFRVIVDTGAVELSESQVALLDRVVAAAPGRIHLVVAARATPGFTTGHLVSDHDLGVIDQAELAFDRSEIRRVARARLGRSLEPAEVASLDVYDGWVTAVLLSLAEPLIHGGTATRVSGVRAQPLIDDFVVRQVLGDLDEDHRQFLFDVAAWDEPVPPVCDAVLGRHDSGRRLDEIAVRITFVEREPTSEFAYRLAPDFAATLRREAQRRDPERVRRIARDAAEYHRVRGERLDGLAPLAAADQWDQVIDGLGVIVREPMDGHELRRAHVLADSVPHDAMYTHPGALHTLVSLELLLGNVARVDALLTELHDRVVADEANQWAGRTFWHGAQAAMGPWRVDPEESLGHAERTLELLDAYSEEFQLGIDEPPFAWARALVLVHGASSLIRTGRFDTARDWLARGERLATATGQVELQVFAAGFEAVLDATVGSLGAATIEAAQTRTLAEQLPGRSVLTLGAEHASTLVALEQDRLEAAEGHLEAMAATEFPHPFHTRALIGLLSARLSLARGRLRKGLRTCDELRASGPSTVPVDLLPELTTTEVRLAVQYGQLEHARRLVAGSPRPGASPAAAALVRLIDGDEEGLGGVLELWPEPIGVRQRIERAVFWALLHARRSDRSACREHLVHAARLAEPDGFTRVFFDAAPGVVDLVQAEQNRDPVPILGALSDRLIGDRTMPPTAAPVLSDTEARVAELLGTHLSVAEMAERLGVSASTLKSRQRSIYRKLGVHKRSEAVMRLKALGAVP